MSKKIFLLMSSHGNSDYKLSKSELPYTVVSTTLLELSKSPSGVYTSLK